MEHYKRCTRMKTLQQLIAYTKTFSNLRQRYISTIRKNDIRIKQKIMQLWLDKAEVRINTRIEMA